jgi:hypothetical protein
MHHGNPQLSLVLSRPPVSGNEHQYLQLIVDQIFGYISNQQRVAF